MIIHDNNGSDSEKLRVIQNQLDDLHTKGQLNVAYEVIQVEMVPKKGKMVTLKCLSCNKVKNRKLAHIKNKPSKGGCICQRKNDQLEVTKQLKQALGENYEVVKVFRKKTSSDKAKYEKRPFHAHVYDKEWECLHLNLNVNNILKKGCLPMTTKMVKDLDITSAVESLWPSLKVRFIVRPQWKTKRKGKMPYYQSMIFPFVECERCGQAYFKRYKRWKQPTSTYCCGLGGTTGKREQFIKKCQMNGGSGILYFAYLRHALGYEYIKQGITSGLDLYERVRRYKQFGFSEVVIYKTYLGNAGEIYDMEQRLLNEKPFVKSKVEFDGSSELYDWDVIERICSTADRKYVRKWRGKIRAGETKKDWTNQDEFLDDLNRHGLDLRKL